MDDNEDGNKDNIDLTETVTLKENHNEANEDQGRADDVNEVIEDKPIIGPAKGIWLDKGNNDNKIYEGNSQKKLPLSKSHRSKEGKGDDVVDLTKIEGYIAPIDNNISSDINKDKDKDNEDIEVEQQYKIKMIQETPTNNSIKDKPKDKYKLKETIRKERERYINLAKRKNIPNDKVIEDPFARSIKNKAIDMHNKPKQKHNSQPKLNEFTKEASIKHKQAKNEKTNKPEEHLNKPSYKSIDKEGDALLNTYTRNKDIKPNPQYKPKLNQSSNNDAYKPLLLDHKDNQRIKKKDNRVSSAANMNSKSLVIAPKAQLTYTNTQVGQSIVKQSDKEIKEPTIKPYAKKRNNSMAITNKKRPNSSISKGDNSTVTLTEKEELIKPFKDKAKANKQRKDALPLLNKSTSVNYIPDETLLDMKIDHNGTLVSSSTIQKYSYSNLIVNNESLSFTNTKAHATINELNDRIAQYEKNNEALLLNNAKLKAKNDQLKLDSDAYIERITIELNEVKSKESSIENLKEELVIAIQCEGDNKLETLKADCNILIKTNEELNEHNMALTLEIENCKANILDSIESLSAIKADKNILEDKVIQLDNTIKEKERINTELIESFASLKNESDAKQSKLQSEINTLKEEKANSDINNKENEDKLNESNDDDDKAIEEVISKAEKVPQLEKTIKEYELKNKKLAITIESLIKALDTETKKNKLLKRQIIEITISNSNLNSNSNNNNIPIDKGE